MDFPPRNLTDSFRVDGNWWLPSRPEKRISGTLTFEGGSELTLELHGAFEDEFHPFSNEGKLHPTIVNGYSIDGLEFTLLSCHRTNSKWNLSSGYSHVWYEPRFALSGACFKSSNDLKIFRCELGLNFLEEWIGKIPFKESFPILPSGKMGLKVLFEPEDFFTISIASIDAKISAIEYFGTGEHASGLRTTSFDRHTRIVVEPGKERDLDWFLDIARSVRDLFYLLTGVVFEIANVRFHVHNPDESERAFMGGEEVELSLFYVQKDVTEHYRVSHFDYPFSLRRLTVEDLTEILEKWFEKKDKLRTVVNLFLGSIRSTAINLQVRFLTLTQALETYHRSTREGKYLNSEDYDIVASALVGAVPAFIPNDLRTSLKTRLKFGNEYSLRKRIKSLLEELEDDCRNLITSDFQRFTSKVVDTRNYLTHYSDELKDGVLDGADLLNTCLRLRLFILVFLLKEMGFSEQRIVEGLSGKNHLVTFGYSEISYSSTDG